MRYPMAMATAAYEPYIVPAELKFSPSMRLASFLLVIGLVLAGWAAYGMAGAAGTSSWVPAKGLSSRVTAAPVMGKTGVFDMSVTYSYQTSEGLVGTSRRVTLLGPVRVFSEADRRAMERQYAPGRALVAKVNPADSRDAVLLTGAASVAPITGPLLRWGVILLVIGVLMGTMELNRQGVIK